VTASIPLAFFYHWLIACKELNERAKEEKRRKQDTSKILLDTTGY